LVRTRPGGERQQPRVCGHTPRQRVVEWRNAPAFALGEALENIGQVFGHPDNYSWAPGLDEAGGPAVVGKSCK